MRREQLGVARQDVGSERGRVRRARLGVDQAAARQHPAGVELAPAQHLEQVDRVAAPAQRRDAGLDRGGSIRKSDSTSAAPPSGWRCA